MNYWRLILLVCIFSCKEELELVPQTNGGNVPNTSKEIQVSLWTEDCQFRMTSLVMKVGYSPGREYTDIINCDLARVAGVQASGESVTVDVLPNYYKDTTATFNFTVTIGGYGGEVTEYNNVKKSDLPLKLL